MSRSSTPPSASASSASPAPSGSRPSATPSATSQQGRSRRISSPCPSSRERWRRRPLLPRAIDVRAARRSDVQAAALLASQASAELEADYRWPATLLGDIEDQDRHLVVAAI